MQRVRFIAIGWVVQLILDLGPQKGACEVVGSVTLSVKPDPMCGAAGHPTDPPSHFLLHLIILLILPLLLLLFFISLYKL